MPDTDPRASRRIVPADHDDIVGVLEARRLALELETERMGRQIAIDKLAIDIRLMRTEMLFKCLSLATAVAIMLCVIIIIMFIILLRVVG